MFTKDCLSTAKVSWKKKIRPFSIDVYFQYYDKRLSICLLMFSEMYILAFFPSILLLLLSRYLM